MDDEKDKTAECDHKGKYLGNGQNALLMGANIVVITSSICSECGQPTISVNKIQIEAPAQKSTADAPSIITPKKKDIILPNKGF